MIRDEWWRCLDPDDPADRATAVKRCPYGVPGSRIWVRETWGHIDDHRSHGPHCVWYRADPCTRCPPTATRCEHGPDKWRPSIFMPRWAARILLEITAVRVERLQALSDDDARAEGAERDGAAENGATYVAPFSRAWDELNGHRFTWASNPWVWVLELRRLAP